MLRAYFLQTCVAAAAVLYCSELGAFRQIVLLSSWERPSSLCARAWGLFAVGSAIFNLPRRSCPHALCWSGRAPLRIASRREPRASRRAPTSETRQVVDNVELIRSGGDREVRVVLSSAGAARIDFKRAADHGFSSRTILVPIDDPKKVVRIAKTITALTDTSVDVVEAQWSGGGSLVINCRAEGDNKVRTVRMRQPDLTVNPVWKGVIEEIEIAGSVGLAAAIDEFERGESSLAKGEREQAVDAYQRAVTAFHEWGKASCSDQQGRPQL